MNKDQCFEFGKIIKPHGIKGELLVAVTAEDSDAYKKIKSVLLEMNGKLIPFEIKKITISSDKAILQMEDVNTEEDTAALLQCKIFLPLSLLPKLKKGQFYYHEIQGFRVVDEEKGEVGSVEEILELPGQDMVLVQYLGKEVLIPLNDDIVLGPVFEEKILKVKLPDGLLELYTSDKEEKPDDED